ncbi:hypothetical protein EDD15DRAFT_2517801 [Pisolithus albus]|nr:hypothetical protein EDD15DRAFT_2517801 [Pisolithus albus]
MQLGVMTNGQGCHVASQLRREAVAALPKGVGGAVICIGQLRRFAREHEREAEGCSATEERNGSRLNIKRANNDAENTSANTPNRPVPIPRVDDSESIAEALSVLTEREMRVVLSGSIALQSVGKYSPLEGYLRRVNSGKAIETARMFMLVGLARRSSRSTRASADPAPAVEPTSSGSKRKGAVIVVLKDTSAVIESIERRRTVKGIQEYTRIR